MIYITPDNKLHDDADGFALTLPTWPKDAVLATQEQIDEIQNPPITFEQAKSQKLNEIRIAYEADSILPVSSLGITWDGGFDSAIKLDAARRLSESAGLTSVTFYDTENQGHALSIADALTVCIDVAVAFQLSLGKKQNLFLQINVATNKDELNLISW